MMFRPHKDVLAREFDGQLVLLHLATGEYFMLNGIGASVWTALGGGATGAHLVSSLCATYEASEEEASRDVNTFVEMLTTHGLIEAAESTEK